MMLIRRSVILLALLLAACNLSVPDVTPTIAPSRTPSPTPIVSNTPQPTIVAQVATNTPSVTPSLTATFVVLPSITQSPTATITRTNQPTATPSDTPTLTLTATNTATFTATLTNAPSATSSFTPTNTATNTPLPTATNTLPPSETPPPSPTPLPVFPTNTPTSTPAPTATVTNAPTATNTLTPSSTPPPLPTATRTLSPEELAAFTPTIMPVGEVPTATPVEAAIAPTLDATPTFITAQAPLLETPQVTPISAEVSPQPLESTPTPQPTVALIVTLPGIVTAIPIAPIGFTGTSPENRVFGLSTSGGTAVTTGGFNLLNDTVLFERNPVDPNLYITTDSSGNMYLTGLNGAGAVRPDMSPFSQFVALSREENNAFVPAAKWSPDGRYVAFIVAGKKTGNDGVWFYQPGQFPPVQLLVDCLPIDVPGCSLVTNPFDPDKWESRSLLWSPDSSTVMVGLNLPQEGRSAIVLVSAVNDPNYRITRPPVLRYDYGAWSRDGSYILVSGRGPDGHEYVGWLNRDGSFNKVLIDSEAVGLWMGFANQADDGSVYALGAPGDRSGAREPLRIYDMNGQALTGTIGDSFPDRVEWSPDGRAVFVQANGRQFVANINGEVREITGQVAGARAINWVNGELPQGSDGGSLPPPSTGIDPVGVAPVGQPDSGTGSLPSQLPQGIVEGSEYQPGTQLRVLVQELNIRTTPGVNSPVARNLPLFTGEYVVILAGPVDADGARWWQVQTSDGTVGWLAGAINGSPTLGQF